MPTVRSRSNPFRAETGLEPDGKEIDYGRQAQNARTGHPDIHRQLGRLLEAPPALVKGRRDAAGDQRQGREDERRQIEKAGVNMKTNGTIKKMNGEKMPLIIEKIRIGTI
jgi:hypothetical protein